MVLNPDMSHSLHIVSLMKATDQNGHHFADDIVWCIFVNEKFCILIKISLKIIPKGPIDNMPELMQIMAWRWSGDKPLYEPMMA